MAKRIELDNDIYIGSNSIAHGRNRLSDELYDSGWQTLALESGFQQVGWNPPMTSWVKPIAYLPSGFKPDNEINVVCRNASGGLAIIAITSQGIFWLNQDGVGDVSSGTIVLSATYIAA